MSIHDVLNVKWYPMPDDLIGGWCIMTTPDAPSLEKGVYVGDFINQEIARHVADVHNHWLATGSPE